jgi:hypothetical protein
MKITGLAFLLALALLMLGNQMPLQAVPTVTNVCGLIAADTLWSLTNSPYAVCSAGVTVGTAATLAIEPGVTVQFENSGTNKLTVSGVLRAIGTPTQPITLTGVVTTPGSWGGVSAHNTALAPATVELRYVTLDYGGVNGSYGAQLYADQAVVTVTHSLIRYGDSHGIYIAYTNPQANIHDTTFISNTSNAVQLNQRQRRERRLYRRHHDDEWPAPVGVHRYSLCDRCAGHCGRRRCAVGCSGQRTAVYRQWPA